MNNLSPSPISIVEYQSKNHLVFNILKENILSGELKPGERIIIRKFSSFLKVSETPVRESLKMLESEGLVSSIPHIGFVVTELDTKELENILTIRLNLECLATNLAVDNINNKTIEALIENLERMEATIKKDDKVEYGCLNREFHQIIYKSSDNQSLYKLILDLWDRSARARSVFLFDPKIIKQSYEEHKQIVNLLKRKDRAVCKIIEKHKKRSFDSLLKYVHNPKDND
jgi:DNA-binding GntR family transcriptional regulator